MVDAEIFQRRLAKLETLLADLRSLATTPRDEYLADRARQAEAERWLHLAAECVLDLAHHLIADRGWRASSSYRDAIRVLREEGVVDEPLASELEQWAGLRNVLVHLYLDVDHAIIFDILHNDLDQLQHFAEAVSRAAGDGT